MGEVSTQTRRTEGLKALRKIRKQIYLNPWQEDRLVELARKANASEAEIIRKAIDAYLLAVEELPHEHPLSGLAGLGASKEGGAGASDHDRVIYQC